MQAKVPKFIDIEDKVVGPLTWRQFAFLGGGASFAMLFLWRFQSFLGVPLAALSLGFAAAFAFHKINGRPFAVFLTSFWNYQVNPRRYFWEKERAAAPRKPRAGQPTQAGREPRAAEIDETQLHQIADALDTHRAAKRKDYR